MPVATEDKSFKALGVIFACALVLFAVLIGIKLLKTNGQDADRDADETQSRLAVKSNTVVDYDNLDKDKELKALMDKRKEAYNINKGVDIIVKSDETLKIGDTKVPMQEIIDQIQMEKGSIIEKDVAGEENGIDGDYGIYIVQPGDNIWNIHFRFLKDHLEHKGVAIAPLADEPDPSGFSSGVGKLLKFSENMVYIYNIREHKLDFNLNLIHPLSKIVVYNMAQVFALLNQIDYEHVNRIEFDGDTIWIPAIQ
jgi:hypothetical protein